MKTNFGKQFEKRIINEARDYTCIKIPEEVRGFYGKGKTAQVKTSFDFAAGINGQACFFDAKAQGVGTLNLKTYILGPKKIHQYTALKEAESNGNHAGYVIWFYNQACIAYSRVGDIQGYLDDGLKSINPYLPGLRVQPDNEPINLKKLILGDKCSK